MRLDRDVQGKQQENEGLACRIADVEIFLAPARSLSDFPDFPSSISVLLSILFPSL